MKLIQIIGAAAILTGMVCIITFIYGLLNLATDGLPIIEYSTYGILGCGLIVVVLAAVEERIETKFDNPE